MNSCTDLFQRQSVVLVSSRKSGLETALVGLQPKIGSIGLKTIKRRISIRFYQEKFSYLAFKGLNAWCHYLLKSGEILHVLGISLAEIETCSRHFSLLNYELGFYLLTRFEGVVDLIILDDWPLTLNYRLADRPLNSRWRGLRCLSSLVGNGQFSNRHSKAAPPWKFRPGSHSQNYHPSLTATSILGPLPQSGRLSPFH